MDDVGAAVWADLESAVLLLMDGYKLPGWCKHPCCLAGNTVNEFYDLGALM